jgi:hypothetical protein
MGRVLGFRECVVATRMIMMCNKCAVITKT